MMIERPIALALNCLAVALLVPQAVAALQQPDYDYGVIDAVGIVVASLGAGLGSLLAAAHSQRWQRYAGFAAFGVIALGYSAAAAVCGWHVDHVILRCIALVAASVPLVLWALVVLRLRDGEA